MDSVVPALHSDHGAPSTPLQARFKISPREAEWSLRCPWQPPGRWARRGRGGFLAEHSLLPQLLLHRQVHQVIGQRLRSLIEGGIRGLERGQVFAFERFLHALHQRLDLGDLRRLDLLADLREGLAGRAEHVAALPLGLDPLPLGQVVEGVLDRLGHHFLHILVADIDRAGQLHDLLVARLHVAGEHAQDSVGVDLELDPDARHAFWRRRKFQLERAERPVVLGQLALALEHLDLHRFLVVDRRGEELARLGRDGRVARDDHVHQPAEGLDSQRQGSDVEQDHVLHAAFEDAGLEGGAERHRLVRVRAGVRLAPEDLLHQRAHQRHPGLAADQNHVVEGRPASASRR